MLLEKGFQLYYAIVWGINCSLSAVGWKQFQNNAFLVSVCSLTTSSEEASITKVYMLINTFSSKPLEMWPKKQQLLEIYGIVKHFISDLYRYSGSLLFFGRFIDSDIPLRIRYLNYVICENLELAALGLCSPVRRRGRQPLPPCGRW